MFLLFVFFHLSIEDIYAIVLHNLIQSTLAMTNSEMKTSRSFQVPKLICGSCLEKQNPKKCFSQTSGR